MSTLILAAYRVSRKVDLFKDVLEPSTKLAYTIFKKHDFVEILHQMLIMEVTDRVTLPENKDFPMDEKDRGILSGDPIHTFHGMKNKFTKASNKKVAGDPFDQNLKVMIKWDSEYYYLKFLVNGKISSDIYDAIIKDSIFEEFSYASTDIGDSRGTTWKNLLVDDKTFINFLQFDILSAERIADWIMEPIFDLPAGKEWACKFDIADIF